MLYKSNSEKDTILIGKTFGEKLFGGEIVLLCGNLGSGKTQFVKGVALALGINEQITSPTFTFMKQYKISQKNLSFLYHIDLYRIENKMDIETLGIDDVLLDKNGITLTEWAEKLENVPSGAFVVKFKYEKGDQRTIEISSE